MTSPQTGSRARQAHKKATAGFAKLSDQFIKEWLALSPINASQAGYHLHKDLQTGKVRQLDAELDDFSASSFARQTEFYKHWRERFRGETPTESLPAEDAADWRLIDDQISLALLELEGIQSYRHNPTVYVEAIGNSIFLPLTQGYAPLSKRLEHIISRLRQVPRAMQQARENLVNADPVFVHVAMEENQGNVDLILNTIRKEVPPGTELEEQFNSAAPAAIRALQDFSKWLRDELSRREDPRSWRLGAELYEQKFRYVMQTEIAPRQVLAQAEKELASVRRGMLELALPMHRQMYPGHDDHADLGGRERENKIIGEVLHRISDEHPHRERLIEAVKKDLESIKQFIRDKKLVALGPRENLRVIPTPPFMRGIYSVAGFHSAPPLEPQAEAQYWVTPIDRSTPEEKAESKLREYNNWALLWLTIHEALPGHYVQFEHANDIQPPRRRILRTLFGNGPYVEGWAEYIAQVMMDAGFANNDPRFRLVMRKIRLRLLANAILDVRMHTMNMSDEQALDLMINQAFQTRAEAEGKLVRAKLSSAQLPTYYVGLRDWLQLRRDYETAKGDSFNLQEFHDRALEVGPLPIAAVRELLLRKREQTATSE